MRLRAEAQAAAAIRLDAADGFGLSRPPPAARTVRLTNPNAEERARFHSLQIRHLTVNHSRTMRRELANFERVCDPLVLQTLLESASLPGK
jgi:hypothetical protein